MNRRVGWDVDPARLLSPTKRKKMRYRTGAWSVAGLWFGGYASGWKLKGGCGRLSNMLIMVVILIIDWCCGRCLRSCMLTDVNDFDPAGASWSD